MPLYPSNVVGGIAVRCNVYSCFCLSSADLQRILYCYQKM